MVPLEDYSSQHALLQGQVPLEGPGTTSPSVQRAACSPHLGVLAASLQGGELLMVQRGPGRGDRVAGRPRASGLQPRRCLLPSWEKQTPVC